MTGGGCTDGNDGRQDASCQQWPAGSDCLLPIILTRTCSITAAVSLVWFRTPFFFSFKELQLTCVSLDLFYIHFCRSLSLSLSLSLSFLALPFCLQRSHGKTKFLFSKVLQLASLRWKSSGCRSCDLRPCGRHVGVSENRGYLFWGPYNKDPTI